LSKKNIIQHNNTIRYSWWTVPFWIDQETKICRIALIESFGGKRPWEEWYIDESENERFKYGDISKQYDQKEITNEFEGKLSYAKWRIKNSKELIKIAWLREVKEELSIDPESWIIIPETIANFQRESWHSLRHQNQETIIKNITIYIFQVLNNYIKILKPQKESESEIKRTAVIPLERTSEKLFKYPIEWKIFEEIIKPALENIRKTFIN
jgi:hypothetical protein